MKLESFSTILSDCTSKYNKIKKEDYLSAGQFPIIDQGKKFVGGYTDDGNLITDVEKELIVFGDHTKILKFIDFPIAIGADGVKVLHVNKEKADPRYIYYFLKSVKLTNAGYSRHFKFLKEIKIPLPENIKDQIKIARLLNHVETLITQRKQSIVLLDELLRSTFLMMFEQGNNQKFPLQKLDEVATKITDGEHGTVERIENGRLYFMARNITVFNTIDLKEVSYISEEDHNRIFKRCNPETGDLMMVCVGATIGKVSLVPEFMEPFSLARSVALIKPIKAIIAPEYLLWFFNSELGKRQVKNSTNSAGQGGLYTGKIKEINIPVPPIQIQNQFALRVQKVETLKSQYQASLNEFENIFGALSKKAFSGDLDRVKKKSEEVMEQDDLEQYSKSTDLKKEKVDISNMSYAEYLDFPEELQIKYEKWMFDFLGEDEFYQFLLKDKFKDISFTLGELETKLHDFFYHGGDMDFDNEKWKQIIFKFLEANPPLIEQYFDKESATIKLKLTDEAFKA